MWPFLYYLTNMSATTAQLQMIMGRALAERKNLWVIQNSTHFFKNTECDVITQSRSGYLIEVEIKRTSADAKVDKDKKRWIDLRKLWGENGPVRDPSVFNIKRMPNRYFMASEKGVIKPEDLHPWAGLIHIHPESQTIEVIKKAPLLHKQKPSFRKTMMYVARRSTRREFGAKYTPGTRDFEDDLLF